MLGEGGDGPSDFLLKYMEQNKTDEGNAPNKWEGYRKDVL